VQESIILSSIGKPLLATVRLKLKAQGEIRLFLFLEPDSGQVVCNAHREIPRLLHHLSAAARYGVAPAPSAIAVPPFRAFPHIG